MNELVSVIVPVYNVEKYLRKCVDSILGQTYKNLEIILVDDGSEDKSGEICDEYEKKDSRIKVLHKENGGISSARNLGMKYAKGEYFVFVDSDDWISKDHVEYLKNMTEEDKTEIAVASYRVISGKKEIDGSNGRGREVLGTEEALRRLLLDDGFTTQAGAKIYKRKLFDGIEFPDGKICEDNGTIYKLIMKCDRISYGGKNIYFYFKRSESIMTSSFSLKKMDLVGLVDLAGKEILKEYPKLKNEVERKKVEARFSILRQALGESSLGDEERKAIDKIEKELRKRKWKVIKNGYFGMRNRIAMVALAMGEKMFAWSWKVYSKIRY